MNKKIKHIIMLFLGFVVMGLGTTVYAQDINDAKRAIKAGDQEKRADNYGKAIEAFGKCIQICNQLGDKEGIDELLSAAQKKFTKSHLDYGNKLLKQNKFEEALKHYNKTLELSNQYNLSNYKEKAEKNIPKVHYAQGKNHLSGSDYQEAIALFDKAIDGDSDYGWAYIRKAFAYSKIDSAQQMEQTVKDAIQVGKNTEQEKVIRTAKEIAYKFFYNKGATALKAKNYGTAIPNLEKAIQYNGNSTLYHYLAISYAKESQYEKAVENEKKVIEALKAEKSQEDLAQYYYNLGTYYENLSQSENACEAYSSAAFGKYKETAEYKIEHVLNCE